ncbi:NAD(+) diphosphatase [Gorillibacterium sp. sgz5001074]|uniref:NAD(+) diphosphatase n=1 Tax=Gorillibacterium sp. sgz5001074 TaxID=3446695 RepID=UPI003F66A135
MLNPRESIYEQYIPAVNPDPEYGGGSYWFVFSGGKMLVRSTEGGPVSLPLAGRLEELELPGVQEHGAQAPLYLGTWEGVPAYTVQIAPEAEAPAGGSFTLLRALYGSFDEGLFHLAGRAYQIADWDASRRFCSRCATPMEHLATERAKKCPACGFTTYPPVSPAVITAIMKGRQILLAHAKHFPNNMHSLIAGFVEPGETLEDAVQREIREEVGLQVRNIRYFGSQQWPFPNSLMIGFIAEYESGEIAVDGEEIVAADWFEPESLPELPNHISIARKIIDWVVSQAAEAGR